MEMKCIQDTKICREWDFDKNEGVFRGKDNLEGRRKTKRKAPDFSDAVAIFCGI